jgi:hypothetical protein
MPPAPVEQHAETRSVSGVVGTASRTRSGAERRSRTTTVAIVPEAQNGTSGALASCKHARRWAAWAMLRAGSEWQASR